MRSSQWTASGNTNVPARNEESRCWISLDYGYGRLQHPIQVHVNPTPSRRGRQSKWLLVENDVKSNNKLATWYKEPRDKVWAVMMLQPQFEENKIFDKTNHDAQACIWRIWEGSRKWHCGTQDILNLDLHIVKQETITKLRSHFRTSLVLKLIELD